MIKVNDWYFLPNNDADEDNDNYLGILNKVVKIKDNPNYVDVEQWTVLRNRKFEAHGISEMDAVGLQKLAKKINAPPKTFEILYSSSVKGKVTTDNKLGTQSE